MSEPPPGARPQESTERKKVGVMRICPTSLFLKLDVLERGHAARA
jgi:hypothetical protein